jgi:hypothetical protein
MGYEGSGFASTGKIEEDLFLRCFMSMTLSNHCILQLCKIILNPHFVTCRL